MLISVALPVYNGVPLLREALASILAQDAELEVILSDDCSRDETLQYLSSLDDPRIKIINNTENIGIFGNLNRCLSACTGQYIQIFCQDDVMKPGYLKSQATFLERYPDAGLVYGSHALIDEDSKPIPIDDEDITPEVISRPLYRWIASHYGSLPASLSSVMLRRNTIEVVGLFDASYRVAGDLEYYNRVSEAFLFTRNSQVLHLVRSHPGMTSKAATTGAAYLWEERRLQKVMNAWWTETELDRIKWFRAQTRGRYHLGWVVRSVARGEIRQAFVALWQIDQLFSLWRVLLARSRAVLPGHRQPAPYIRAPEYRD